VLSTADFIARLCALVRPPRFHLMRYLGVLAGNSSLRAEVVPKEFAALPAQLPLFDERDEPTTSAKSTAKETAEPSRHPWAHLLERVFAVDILVCTRCGGRLRIVEIAKKPDDAPPRAPPRAELQPFIDGQLRLAFG
jgi:Putative transposase